MNLKLRIAGVAFAAAVIVGSAGCSTGVRDYEGWAKAVRIGEPCAELFDIRADLPASVDRVAVDADLARIGCASPDSVRTDGKSR
jgi:hypothetical protein